MKKLIINIRFYLLSAIRKHGICCRKVSVRLSVIIRYFTEMA